MRQIKQVLTSIKVANKKCGTKTNATQFKKFKITEVMLLPDPFQMGLEMGDIGGWS